MDLFFLWKFSLVSLKSLLDNKEYDYLLNLRIMSLTKEKKEKKLAEKERKTDEMYAVQKTTKEEMWRTDLNEFLKELDVS